MKNPFRLLIDKVRMHRALNEMDVPELDVGGCAHVLDEDPTLESDLEQLRHGGVQAFFNLEALLDEEPPTDKE